MSDKLEKAVDAIIEKSKDGRISWERTDKEYYKKNPFYFQYIQENVMGIDGINSYTASYGDGYIYFTNQVEDGYKEIAIQPNKNACLSILSTGRSAKLTALEETIKNELDNTDDFIASLIDE